MRDIEKDLQLVSGSVLLRPYQLGDVDTMYEAVRESIAELSIWIPGHFDSLRTVSESDKLFKVGTA